MFHHQRGMPVCIPDLPSLVPLARNAPTGYKFPCSLTSPRTSIDEGGHAIHHTERWGMLERVPRIISVTVLCLMMLPIFTSCSGKRVAASSGDASSTTKEKGTAAPVETIKPESLATVPDEKSSTLEASRAPVDARVPEGGGGPESSSSSALSASAPSDVSNLGDIFFDFDQYTIRRDAQPVLSANAAWINSRTGKSVVIEGHCDERGTQAYNLVLGDKRARSAKRYLEDLGVSSSRLKTTSYGEIRPFCKERDENCYQQNRRAHFVVQ
jgi:peptidoglycan-associated lipoprotein